jgi:hypothetical protein
MCYCQLYILFSTEINHCLAYLHIDAYD